MNSLPQPDDVPNTWRDRTQLHHFVGCFEFSGEVMVVSRWHDKCRGWQWKCNRLEALRLQFELEKN